MAIEIDISGQGIQTLADMFGASDKQIHAAMRSTYGKMGRWLRVQSVRGLSQRLQIQQKILRTRIRQFRLQSGMDKGEGVKVWYGLNDIPFSRLNPRKSGKGIKAAGGRYEEGAFFAQIYGKRRVMKRVGDKRVPLRVVYAEVADAATTYIEDTLVGTALFDVQFYKFLEHELKWRTSILK